MSTLDDNVSATWNAIADEWVAHADRNDYHNDFLLPMALKFLGDVSGKRVLDLGCGEGSYARALTHLGARVTGMDASERLITVAGERTAAAGLQAEFIRGDASDLSILADDSYDIVLAAMALMSISKYKAAIAEASRVLHQGGSFWLSILHPCFNPPGSGWCRNANGEAQHLGVDRYFERTSWRERITERFSQAVTRYHRPLEDYIAAALTAGLVLKSLREPCASLPDLERSSRFWTIRRIPYFLFMQWQKQ